MVATVFEERVNLMRGYATFVITLASFQIVLVEPHCLLFWTAQGYALNVAQTGVVGLCTAALFLLYLLVDTVVGICCRHRFRRSMNAVLLHHVVVGVGIAAFLIPAPPRGFFLYVWGELLTACRLLPAGLRFRARHFVFAGRRVLWLFLLLRDVTFFRETRTRYGLIGASVPPLVAILLLGLDTLWWREHARSDRGAARVADDKKGGGDGASGALMAKADAKSADDVVVHGQCDPQSEDDDEEKTLLRPAATGGGGSGGGDPLPSSGREAGCATATSCEHQASAPASNAAPRAARSSRMLGNLANGKATRSSSGTGLSELHLDAARNASYDDLQIHTP